MIKYIYFFRQALGMEHQIHAARQPGKCMDTFIVCTYICGFKILYNNYITKIA